MKLCVFLLAALFTAGTAAADSAPTPVRIDSVSRFLDQQRDLRDDLKSSKFRHLRHDQRKRLLAAQDEMFTLLEGKRSVNELSHDEQIELYNAQHLVAGIITDAELDRPICKREKRVGSNMSQTVCTTKRQMDSHRNEVQSNMRAPKTCDWSVSACGG